MLNIVKAGLSGTIGKEHGNIVGVSLSSLLSREDLIAKALQNENIRKMIERESQRTLMRHDQSLQGEPE